MRRALTFAVLSAITIATTACGSAADSADGPRHSSPGQHPLTEEQLTKALPDGNELVGFTTVPQSLALLEAEDVVTTDKPACRPIADMMSVRPKHVRRAMVWATIKPDNAPPEATPGSLTLTSHAVEEAEAWMAEIRKALAGCSQFTATSERGWTHRFSVRPLPSAKVGDDSVTYLLTNPLAPEAGGNAVTVVRTGGSFATYLMSSDKGQPPPVPASIAKHQHRKLQTASTGSE
ncbi:hypothetical protein ABZO31_00070 [Streptomyces sp. HUAS MG47]|uniref:hypothetical protein n=1 Tax=Streptomyces solicamelliae TaxID=3231716 RepID=UPI003877AAC2